MELTYRRTGDYYIPNLAIDEAEKVSIGKYGRQHKKYLEEHRPAVFQKLLMAGKLFSHAAEIDKMCRERMERMIPAMTRSEGVTERLKAQDPILWAQKMNNIHSSAEEIILRELVYTY